MLRLASSNCRIGILVFLVGVLLPATAISQATTGTRYALVIGVDKYTHGFVDFKNLKYAEKDATAIKDALAEKQYVVTDLINEQATKAAILSELSDLADKTNAQDTVLIYFAGHGVKRAFGATEYSYWVPYVPTLSPPWDNIGIRVTHLLEYVSDIRAGKKLLLLDHCHSALDVQPGSARDSSRNFGEPFNPDEFKEEVDDTSPTGLVILGAAQEEAYELQKLQHGIFTSVLLDAFNSTAADRDRNDALDVSELRVFIRDNLPSKISSLKASNDLAMGFRQVPFAWSEGQAVDWKLLDVKVDLGSLVTFFGTFASRGELSIDVRRRVASAIQNVTESTNNGIDPSGRDKKVVDELIKIRDLGDDITWAVKAAMFLGAIQGDGS